MNLLEDTPTEGISTLETRDFAGFSLYSLVWAMKSDQLSDGKPDLPSPGTGHETIFLLRAMRSSSGIVQYTYDSDF